MPLSSLIEIFELELEVMVFAASSYDEKKEVELADRSLFLGMKLYNKRIALSDLAVDSLRTIESKNLLVFDSFKHTYNAAR